MKYAISKQFFPFMFLKPPISEEFLKIAVPNMKVPKSIFKDKDIEVTKEIIEYHGGRVESFVMKPRNATGKLPCLFYIHGGGFVLEAAGYHYKNALDYAKKVNCIVVFPKYRLAPEYPFPIFYEDCYAVFYSIYERAESLGIDINKIGVGGDSAGSTLAVGLIQMCIDRKHPVKFVFQMLPYPFLDMRGISDSNKKYVDTPMWNSKLSDKIAPMTKVDKNHPHYVYYSPIERDRFDDLPQAYIETAEFDCLHDDGIIYASKLQEASVRVELNETKGTIHGYDIVKYAPISKDSMSKRIAFMKKVFGSK